MNQSATIIADSINEQGNRITTFELVYWRAIHSEIMTHRMFSRNSASSRAIPFAKMVKSVEDNLFIPIAWQKDHSGMQGNEYLNDELSIQFATSSWLNARDWAVRNAESLHSSSNGYESVTKQVCNRLLEPFMYHKVIVTATDFDNFFDLRCPNYEIQTTHPFLESQRKTKNLKSWKDVIDFLKEDGFHPEYWTNMEQYSVLEKLKLNKGKAEIHLMDLAEKMWDAYNESQPVLNTFGHWHIPYLNKMPVDEMREYIRQKQELTSNNTFTDLARKISQMMCARVSYTTIDTDDSVWTVEKYVQKYNELVASKHASPLEHVAKNQNDSIYYANFKGWKQNRMFLEEQKVI